MKTQGAPLLDVLRAFPLVSALRALFLSPYSSQASLPANTNVLFVNLRAVQSAMQGGNQQQQQQYGELRGDSSASASAIPSLPGMIMNLKKKVSFIDDNGRDHRQVD